MEAAGHALNRVRCLGSGRLCGGYHALYSWSHSRDQIRKTESLEPGSSNALLFSLSSLGLPSDENKLMEHFIKNIARLSLAVDYDGNGYRRLAVVSLNDAALLNAILTVSSSHLNRWHGRKDSAPKFHLRKALHHLQKRLLKPAQARSEITFMTMLLLLIYELCEGTQRWKYHYEGLLTWVRLRDGCSDVDPFLTGLLGLIATQVILHMPGLFREKAYNLLSVLFPQACSSGSVDVLSGFYIGFPELLVESARLHDEVMRLRAYSTDDDMLGLRAVYGKAKKLQRRIQATQLGPENLPSLGMIGAQQCTSSICESLVPADILDTLEVRQAARASAEVFRHALHIYVYRILHNPTVGGECPMEIQSSVDDVFRLIPDIPDTVGPGSFLGWALVVIGAEIDALERRQHIKRRLQSLATMALNHGVLAISVLEEVWHRRDMAVSGLSNNRLFRWEEVLEDMEIDLALI
ncbi:hypothetical protein GCG54_00005346 [Colletotrichum gloeosporioides]|uniref:Fungal-specific transcription factor domain-containing protein n=1 Tax=Colletotrichum gloeosporioides TaxID=474922 RepID=A0A8H4CU22_COLGL|nr:uncharacterized protein GCG54_00005346 [Colletotrichum gloeosporioides]KAF3809802.1 hypothetical protein GCG54_00005346 [Colletotrichum gloeosporioides]